jgi:hypothetical protein
LGNKTKHVLRKKSNGLRSTRQDWRMTIYDFWEKQRMVQKKNNPMTNMPKNKNIN